MSKASKIQTVKLREKPLKNGGVSLYLEWNSGGKTEKRYLNIHLTKGKSTQEKEVDRKNLAVAQALRNEKELEIISGDVKTIKVNNAEKISLMTWLEGYRDSKAKTSQSGSLQTTINSMMMYVKDYSKNKDVRLKDVDREFCENFVYYLCETKSFIRNTFRDDIARGTKSEKTLAKSTAKLYFDTLSTAMNEAVNRDMIPVNPLTKVSKSIKKLLKSDSEDRDYLSIEELKRMEDTDANNPYSKQAFLFACYTGLRISDVVSLKWENIKEMNDDSGKLYIDKEMIKTHQDIKIPLSASAMRYLPSRDKTKKTELVFSHLPKQSSINSMLKTWAKAAHVDKLVTFHVARHTFATLLLTKGADLYVVSTLLGHQDIRTTQIYAKIVDERINQTIELIDTI